MGGDAGRGESGGADVRAGRLLTIAVAQLRTETRLGATITVTEDVAELRLGQGFVLLVEVASLQRDPLAAWLPAIASGEAGLVLLGPPPVGLVERLPPGAMITVVEDPRLSESLYVDVQGILARVDLLQRAEEKSRQLSRSRYELNELVTIARALTQERDIDALLTLILEKSRYITGADAGSIYVLEGSDPDDRRRTLRFKLSQNESCKFESSEFTMPVSMRSISGAAVLTRRPISIADVYEIPGDAPYGFDRSFDEKVGYRSGSMICVPLISAAQEVIGVIQLINKKRTPERRLTTLADFDELVVPFDVRSEELLQTLASQAAIALENAMLYKEIQAIFEGFVRASVQAIEQRDPTTSGHSLRVSVLSCRLAEVVDGVDHGPYAEACFTKRDLKELEYASLLHDFGKIGVREQVLVKAKKLYPHDLEAIRQRLDYVSKALEVDVLARKLELIRLGADGASILRLDDELAHRRAELEEAWRVIRDANEPTVLKQGEFSRIAELGSITYTDGSGEVRTLLRPEEVVALQVTRGSLSSGELDEIRSHVSHTYNFLARIPWGKSFDRVPIIAGSHHERLNGTGYPNRLSAEEIPLQSKIMSIADIYDALTARDRPYKKAMPAERALDILDFEVRDGHVDGELVRIFREAGVFRAADRGDLSY
jgi:HD-GYP domain-containing protein (c-di-GMP phosphodiesterase class II)